jgi:restriction system protein
MARRPSKEKRESDFIDAALKLSSVGTFFLVLFTTRSFKIAFIATLIVFGLTIALLIMRRMNHQEKLKRSGITDIDKMDGRQFEHYLGVLFKNQGYSVKVTRASGDYGADLIIAKDGKKIVVQAKRYSKNVGLKAVQEAQASIAHYGASEAWVVSNSEYTYEATELARSNKVKLFSRDDLVEMILKMNPETVPTPKQITEQLPQINMICERCGRNMVLRKGPRGEFYGCSGFPKCRKTEPVV